MAKTWSEISSSKEFQNETPDVQKAIKDDYFNRVIRPQVEEAGDDVNAVYTDFINRTQVDTAAVLDDTLARTQSQLMDMGSRGELKDDSTATLGTPSYLQNTQSQSNPFIPDQVAQISKDVTGRDPNDQAQVDANLQKQLREPFMAEAAKLVGTDQYRGMTQSQIADQLAQANYQGNAAEAVATVATLPFTGGASVLGRIATTAGLSGAGTALNQAVDTASSGQNRFDGSEIGKSTAFGLGAGVAGEAITAAAKAAAPVLARVLPESLGGANAYTKRRIAAAERQANIANSTDRDYLEAVNQNGNGTLQDIMQQGLRDADGVPIATPNQVLTDNTLMGRALRSAEQRGFGKGNEADFSSNYKVQDSGAPLERAQEAVDAVPLRNPSVQDTLTAAANRTDAEIRTAYNSSKKTAQDILDSQRIKSIKLPSTNALAKTQLSNHADMGGNLLSNGGKKALQGLNRANIKNIDDLDKWKRTLSEQSQKDFRAGEHQSSQAIRSVLDSLRNEADDLVSRISPDASSIYREADDLFGQVVPDYGKGSAIRKVVNQQNEDVATNPLLRGQNARYNTEQVSSGLLNSLNRANSDVSAAQRTLDNMTPEELAVSGDQVRGVLDSALARQTTARNSIEDFNNSLAADARQRAFNDSNKGDNFNYRKYGQQLNQMAPSINEAQRASDIAAGGESVLNQNTMNEGLTNLSDLFGRVRNPSAPNSKLLDSSTATAAIADMAFTGGVATAANFAKKAFYDNGIIDGWLKLGAKGRKYVDYATNPTKAGEMLRYLQMTDAGEKPLEEYTKAQLKNTVEAIVDTTTRNQTVLNRLVAKTPGMNEAESTSPEMLTAPAPIVEPETVVPVTKHTGDIEALYNGFKNAETGGLKDPWIRTKARDASGAGESTAYGPVQITGSLVRDMLTRYPDQFTAKEKEYMSLMIDQAKLMLSNPNDSVYGYGGKGVLGDTKAWRNTYEDVAKKFINILYQEQGGDYNKLIRRWRGLDDQAYSNKVSSGINAYLNNSTDTQEV